MGKRAQVAAAGTQDQLLPPTHASVKVLFFSPSLLISGYLFPTQEMILRKTKSCNQMDNPMA